MTFALGLLLVCLAAPSSAQTTATSSVASGIELFHRGEFEASIRVLELAIAGLEDPRPRAEARLFVGLAQAVLGSVTQARASFREALIDDPEIAPDDRRIPPAIIAAFEQTKRGVTGRLVVEAEKPANVFIDDVEAGPVPFASNISVGRHRVRVLSEDGSEEYVRDDVLVRAGEKTRVEAVLALRPGALTLTSIPSSADVWLGDQHLGRTPIKTMSFPAGPISLVLKLPRHRDELVAVRIRPGETTLFEAPLKAEHVREDFGEVPWFGPDLRDGVDRWMIVAFSGFGGLAPISSSVPAGENGAWPVSGGIGGWLELGAEVYDLVEMTGVLGIETFGPEAAFFEEIAPASGGITVFTLGAGRSVFALGSLRLGLHSRVVLARLGRVRAFAGVGYYWLGSIGEALHLGFETSRAANDRFEVRASLGGSAVVPSAGVKITAFEGEFRGNYVAVDIMVEGRVDFMSFDDAKVRANFASEAGRARADGVRMNWERALSAEPSAVAAGLIIWFGGRL